MCFWYWTVAGKYAFPLLSEDVARYGKVSGQIAWFKSLFGGVLRPFASHGLNMTKIESRPSRRKAWEYLFFVDIEGHMDEEKLKKAMEEVKSRCLFMKILGSYPAHN